ncbi:hypothetical protein QWY85_15730 [Neolewinella lacunae]|uniref:Uncharacterized protein n=1 Tax=Neolewinella lacunae TaxID=1517758 RepID=A0A923PPC3_9BACT|nr:hypothetical protein [Neolewinella lacunae]MBC6994938.1 hypothetical protein [Neolewinella lacunae]MDN3636118.1 hypothetical protein [Neolewinella lacunae]
MRKLPFSLKNQIVSNFGLKNYTAADSLRNALYDLYRNESLPDGIDEFFNYDFFKIDSLNIWGYEWFEELPSDRFSSSFTKIVYYVYSTDDEGNDKDQLYRLHVLMYHGNSDKFDYVLTKRLETATNEISGTLWCYTYKDKIDLEKLKMDVMKVINGELNPCLSEKE